MNDTTVSRRRALQTGTLATIAAGLLGTTTTASAQPSTAAPLVVGTTTNMRALVADVEQHVTRSNAACERADMAENALQVTLSAEQRALFETYDQARHHRELESEELYLAEMARHLPGLAPAIWAMWDHVIQAKLGECCLPAVEGTLS